MRTPRIAWLLVCVAVLSPRASAVNSVAQTWDEAILSAIRLDRPNPPVHARNLFHLSVAMYDAWAAYDSVAVGYLFRAKRTTSDVAAARREAISYAAYRLLRERYALSLNGSASLAALDAQLAALGYDKNNLSTDTSTPAGVGNTVFATVSGWFLNDGARQAQSYADYPIGAGGYLSVNPFLVTGFPGTSTVDVNRWNPLAIANALDQNGNLIGSNQVYQAPQWLGVRPFVLGRTVATVPWIDPGPQPRLGGVGDAQFRNEVVEVIRRSSELTPDDGVFVNVSPGAFGNNSLGANDGTGHPLNPATGLPYASNLVKRGDFARVLAEYWADGPNSEIPPGHWNKIGNAVSDHPSFVKQFGGVGPVLDDLEWDVKLYFTLNAAVHEAACAAWAIKRFYDGGRPISFIRYMALLGRSTQTAGPSYHPNGLPLVPGLIELVTSATAQTGQRHAGLPINAVVVRAWPGQPINPLTQYSGVKWVLGISWLPFQKNTFVTPGFPGYVSGHSTFSHSAAEVLTAMTGSPFFPGGMGIYNATVGTTLTFEYGPSQAIQLQWGTYYDAADQAGLSRLWGGIHVSVDDLGGRRVGSQCGKGVWARAQKYFDGAVVATDPSLTIRTTAPGQYEIRCDTVRGLYYKLQSSPSLTQPFTDDGPAFTQALDSTMFRTDATAAPRKFYKVISALAP